jgi:hypothetical protein
MKKIRVIEVPDSADDIAIPRDKLMEVDVCEGGFSINGQLKIIPRFSGSLAKCAIWLDSDFEWHLGTDDMGVKVLVPTKK